MFMAYVFFKLMKYNLCRLHRLFPRMAAMFGVGVHEK